MTCSNCGSPHKDSPEYTKPYKPENNFGCGCGKKEEEKPPQKKIVRSCHIRYKVSR